MNKVIPIVLILIVSTLVASLIVLNTVKRGGGPVEHHGSPGSPGGPVSYDTTTRTTPTVTQTTMDKTGEKASPFTVTELSCKHYMDARVDNATINVTVRLRVYTSCELYLHNASFVDKDGNTLYYVKLNKPLPPGFNGAVSIDVTTEVLEKTDTIKVFFVIRGEGKIEHLKPIFNETATQVPW